jgi:hypothetical protein
MKGMKGFLPFVLLATCLCNQWSRWTGRQGRSWGGGRDSLREFLSKKKRSKKRR